MQLARFWQPGCSLVMDLSSAVFGDEAGSLGALSMLESRISRFPGRSWNAVLCGSVTPPVAGWLLTRAGLRAGSIPGGKTEIERLASLLEGLTIPLTGTRDFDAAQVTAGGLETNGFDPATGESRCCPGLFAAGEVLNVDGDCGGYNLMFAVCSGMLAGHSAAQL